MEKETYIKVFHRMLDWGWYADTNTFRVFMHILLNANYRPTEYKGMVIKAGECVFGRKAWAKQLGLSEQEIRTAINHLKNSQEITTKATNKFTVITVEKWDFWQVGEGKATKKSTNHQPTTNQQLTTPKEYIDKRNINTSTKYLYKEKPTIDAVREYFKEKQFVIDADYFFNYYDSNDWIDGKGNPVKAWKQKALVWNRKELERRGEQKTNGERNRKTEETPDGWDRIFG